MRFSLGVAKIEYSYGKINSTKYRQDLTNCTNINGKCTHHMTCEAAFWYPLEMNDYYRVTNKEDS